MYFHFLFCLGYAWKNSERLVLQAAVIIFSRFNLALSLIERNLEEVDFANEKFSHKKINNNDFYVDYSATEDIPQDAYSLR